MKNKIIYLLLAIVTISCDGYLKEDSGDLMIPKTIEEYASLLLGEGYPSTFYNDLNWFVLMTDDVEMGELDYFDKVGSGFDAITYGEAETAHTWQMDIENKITDYFWDKRYQNILGCNVIIDALPTIEYEPSQLGKYYNLAAQAYTLRAYHYLCLINTYAVPYSPENLDKPGVIIRTTPQISTDARERSTIREVYKLINDDIEKALEFSALSESSSNKYLIIPAAISFLANRIHFFQENWDYVIENGESFLTDYGTLLDLNTIDENQMGLNGSGFIMMDKSVNPEILFTFGGDYYYVPFLSNPSIQVYRYGYRVSYSQGNSLIQQYEEDDLRLKAYFMQDVFTESWWPGLIPDEWDYKWNYPVKYQAYGNNTDRENWRNVEVILNLAEAYARKSNQISEDAIKWINKLREKRIKSVSYEDLTVSDFASKDELIQFIWDERRRELCFEEAMRFWDLRRQGMPRLEHRIYVSDDDYRVFILPEKSNNWVLAIPRSETNNNFVITQNERDIINAQ